jgi:hypothetical protein
VLGVFKIINGTSGLFTDVDDYTIPSGLYKVNHDANVQNMPGAYNDGFLFVWNVSSSNILQVAIPWNYHEIGGIYMRLKWGTYWLSWYMINVSPIASNS